MSIAKVIFKGITAIGGKTPAKKALINGAEEIASTAVKTTKKATLKVVSPAPTAVTAPVADVAKIPVGAPLKVASATAAKAAAPVLEDGAKFVARLEKDLAPNFPFRTYSAETKKKIAEIFDKLNEDVVVKSNANLRKDINLKLTLITTSCDEKTALALLKDDKSFKRFFNAYNVLSQKLGNKVLSKGDRLSVLTNLTAMAATNKKSFDALWLSKGMDEIAAGRLSLSYLKDVKATDNIDADFFYKLFEKIEKQTNERLLKSGLDVDAVNKYIKLSDDKVCKDTEFINKFITQLEDIKNPELANRLLKKFQMDEGFIQYADKSFRQILDLAQIHPQAVEKALKLKNDNPFGLVNTIDTIKCSDTYKVSDELFETFAKVQKAHPNAFSPLAFKDMNKFLNQPEIDEKLVRQIFENIDEIKRVSDVDSLFIYGNKYNLELLKKCLEKGKFTGEDFYKYYLLGTNQGKLSEEVASKLYKEIYKPMFEVLDGESKRYAERLVDLKINKPEFYDKLEDLGILKLIKERKINPRIIDDLKNGGMKPEVMADIQKLLKGETLIKRFNSTKDILRQTQSGDVASVNGKLYINNKGKLEPWEMSEESFNKLFPLVDRFTTQQGGIGDCYLLTTLDSLYRNPRTRGEYYKMFVEKGDDICVTIPAYKDYLGEVRFPKGEFNSWWKHSNSALNVQMLERTYARTALRNARSVKAGGTTNPITTNDMSDLYERISGGLERDVIRDILPDKKDVSIRYFNEFTKKDKIKDILTNYAANPRYIIEHGYKTGTGFHGVNIESYDPVNEIVTIINPWRTGVQYKVPLKDFLDNFKDLTVVRVG